MSRRPAPGYYDMRDANLSGGRPTRASSTTPTTRQRQLADDERDEDADGLTNFEETHGRLHPGVLGGCYSMEAPTRRYAGTQVDDADSDGDGVRDGADDQDHDDLPNLMELSRFAASGHIDWQPVARAASARDRVPRGRRATATASLTPRTQPPRVWGRVNPFNPCLPATNSRTCTSHPGLSGSGAPFDDSPNWLSLQ